MLKAGVLVQTIDESRKVLARIDAKERRVLIRSGAYGRTTMRRLFKRRKKKKSARGNPPFARAKGASGMKDVRYVVQSGEATIGHIRYPGGTVTRDERGVRHSSSSPLPVPQLLNEGGPAVLHQDHPEQGRRDIPVQVGERPFRDPAFGPTNRFFRSLIAKEKL